MKEISFPVITVILSLGFVLLVFLWKKNKHKFIQDIAEEIHISFSFNDLRNIFPDISSKQSLRVVSRAFLMSEKISGDYYLLHSSKRLIRISAKNISSLRREKKLLTIPFNLTTIGILYDLDCEFISGPDGKGVSITIDRVPALLCWDKEGLRLIM